MECKFCQRIINNKGSLIAHELCCKSNPDKIKHKRSPKAGQQKGCIPWNKGLTKETDKRVKKISKILQEGYKSSRLKHHKTPHSLTIKKQLSKIAKERKLGGYIKGSGRGKKGWYKGIFCDSSWELAYVIYCLDYNISIQRNIKKRQYIFEGKERNYIPDFIVDGKLVEIKGYKSKQWEAKIKFNPDIQVLYEKDLTNIFKYVTTTYGKDFIKLYEG